MNEKLKKCPEGKRTNKKTGLCENKKSSPKKPSPKKSNPKKPSPKKSNPKKPSPKKSNAKKSNVKEFKLECINEIEEFLKNNEKILNSSHSIEWWRSCILTYHDKYGSIGTLSLDKFNPPEISDSKIKKRLINILKNVKINNEYIRKKLELRTDEDRVQMQRPIFGSSMLTITQSKNRKYSNGLNRLLITAVHPKYGIESYRLTGDEYRSLPFKLPTILQPELPNLITGKMSIDKNATNINQLIKQIYEARKSKIGIDEIDSFIERFNLHDDDIWEIFGKLPKIYDEESYYQTSVPNVIPGKQVIIWKTWHSTCGSKDDDTPKITAFIDCVPKNFFTDYEFEWYEYVNKNAPCDFGGGSERGSYQTFIFMNYLQDKTDETIEYGIPKYLDNKFVSKIKDNPYTLNEYQKEQFEEQGYLIIDIPKELQKECQTTECITNFSKFFQVIADDPSFDFTKSECLQRSESQLESMKYWKDKEGDESKYHYNLRKIDEKDPLNPNANNGYTHAFNGGKLIAASSGMGPGSTYTLEPNHLKFQFSDFVTGIMQSFYGKQPLLRVLERFRAKTKNAWSKNTHIDVKGAKFAIISSSNSV
jgi:hypothetical protein